MGEKEIDRRQGDKRLKTGREERNEEDGRAINRRGEKH